MVSCSYLFPSKSKEFRLLPKGREDAVVDVAATFESLGKHQSIVESALNDLDSRNIVGRIWQGDHRVWNEDPTEIADRLGWLNLPEAMMSEVAGLTDFGAEVRDAGFRHVVLLGMGGSSLGPEVLRSTLGSREGYPTLLVLDSTLPAWICAVDAAIDPARTLFLVSSKSGTTIEPNTLYSYYRQRVAEVGMEEKAGGNFIAVTDPGTALAELGDRQGFRRVFPNPPDIGGRYSVLSCFGLVPAALIGLNLGELLGRAAAMQRNCAVAEAGTNPGARLGATMGALARDGRDKLTLVTSPALAGFGLWVEQLLAESLGKSGKGIIPVAGEPALAPESYRPDRFFVYLRLAGDDNAGADALLERLAAEHPVIRLELQDCYDLGAEFYRWEFATAVAGHLLGVHPFDQPDVQGAKDMTDRVLERFIADGALMMADGADGPESAAETLRELLGGAGAGDYLAILAYLADDPAVVAAVDGLRRRVAAEYGIATTAGFGPRYLHSTGQLHKGGPGSGIFLQLTADHHIDLAIPERPYSFGNLADAQASGDRQALQARGRRAARIHLGSDSATAIQRLAESL